MAGVVADRVVVELEAKLDRYNANVLSAERQWTRTTNNISQNMQRTEATVTRSLENIKRALLASTGIFIGAQGLRGIQNLLDGYTRFTNQLRITGLEGTRLAGVQDQLFNIAQRFGAPLENLGTLYSRAAQAGTALGASQNDLMRFTTGVAAALKVQGGSASETSGALLQLSQLLGTGVVRAEEFNSVNEGARPILQAVANGIDKYRGSVAALRNDVIQGNVTSRAFFEGFLRGSAALEQQAARANFTIGASFTILNNALGRYLGQTDQALSLTARLSQALVLLSQNLNIIVPALAGIAAGYAGVKLGSVVFDAVTAATARALAIDQSLAATILAGNASYVSRTGLVLAQAQATATAAAAEVAALQAEVEARASDVAATAAQVEAEQTLVAAMGADVAARERLTVAVVQNATAVEALAVAETALAGAEGRAAVAAEAEAAAVTSATLAKRAGAAASLLFSGALSTLGAAIPFLAIAAITAAIVYYATTARDATFDTHKFAEEGENLRANLAQLQVYARNAAGAIGQVGAQAQSAVAPMLSFANATGEAAQRLYELARARRHELLVALATDEIHARQEREAAAARLASRANAEDHGGPNVRARYGDIRTSSEVAEEARQDVQDRQVIAAAAARERAAQEAQQRAIRVPLTGYLAGSEQENGRDVAGELARVTRDLTVARERGLRAQIDTLQAQQFELQQYRRYRTQGLSPQAAQEASNRDKAAFQEASRGAQGDRNARAGAAASRREQAQQRAAARRAAAEERDSAGDAARYASLERRTNNEIATARAELAGSAEQRAQIERDRIESERQDRNEELRQSERQGQLGEGAEGRTRMLELQRLNDERAALETQVVDLHERQRVAAEARDLAAANIQNERDVLSAQEPLADTMAERHAIALRLLDLQYEQERIELRAVTVANGRTATEEAIARARLRALDRIQAADHAATDRRFEGVGRTYLRGFATDINEQLDQVAVNGLRTLEDQLTSTIAKVFQLGGAFGKVANQIIADLVRIAIQREIIQPLANMLFGGPGGTGGDSSGGIFGFLRNLASAAASTISRPSPGRASGGHVAAGRIYRVNETGIEGFQPSGSGKIIPLGRMNSAASGAVVTVLQTVQVDARGAVMNEEFARLILDRAGDNARTIASQAVVTSIKGAPGAVHRANVLGTV